MRSSSWPARHSELRNKWILHWESVRPVPKITIDFGDGRKLERTITGNSLHYVLSANGEVLDVLPGLWGPQEFLQETRKARRKSTRDFASSPFEENLPISSVVDANGLQLMRVKMRGAAAAAKSPAALRAGGLAVSKMVAERPALTALAPPKR